MLNRKKLFSADINEIKSADDDLCLIIKDIGFNEANELFEQALKPLGITKIIELKSHKKDKIINMVKAVCKNEVVLSKLIKEGIKIGYIKHRAEQFIKKPTLIMCYKCGFNGHTSVKCRNNLKCIRCSKTDHESKDCPIKGNLEDYVCPNCNEPHPATYAGC